MPFRNARPEIQATIFYLHRTDGLAERINQKTFPCCLMYHRFVLCTTNLTKPAHGTRDKPNIPVFTDVSHLRYEAACETKVHAHGMTSAISMNRIVASLLRIQTLRFRHVVLQNIHTASNDTFLKTLFNESVQRPAEVVSTTEVCVPFRRAKQLPLRVAF